MNRTRLIPLFAAAVIASAAVAQDRTAALDRYDDYAACLASQEQPLPGLPSESVWEQLSVAESNCDYEKQAYLVHFDPPVQKQIEQRFLEKKRAIYLSLTE